MDLVPHTKTGLRAAMDDLFFFCLDQAELCRGKSDVSAARLMLWARAEMMMMMIVMMMMLMMLMMIRCEQAELCRGKSDVSAARLMLWARAEEKAGEKAGAEEWADAAVGVAQALVGDCRFLSVFCTQH
jgi:hypothetical protein